MYWHYEKPGDKFDANFYSEEYRQQGYDITLNIRMSLQAINQRYQPDLTVRIEELKVMVARGMDPVEERAEYEAVLKEYTEAIKRIVEWPKESEALPGERRYKACRFCGADDWKRIEHGVWQCCTCGSIDIE